jgi:hypothetical protein
MAAGLTARLMYVSDIIALIDSAETSAGFEKIRKQPWLEV